MGNTSSDLSKKYKKVSPVREVMSLLVRNKAAMAGLIFPILLVGGITFRRSAVRLRKPGCGAEHF